MDFFFDKFAPDIRDIVKAAIISALTTLAWWLYRRYGLRLLRYLRPYGSEDTSRKLLDQRTQTEYEPGPDESAYLKDVLAGAVSIEDKLTRLNEKRSQLKRELPKVRSEGSDDSALRKALDWIEAALFHMTFLTERDVVSERYILQKRLAKGETTHVWRAYDRSRDSVIALKILCYPLSNDASAVERFCRTANLMQALPLNTMPGIVETQNVVQPKQGPPLYCCAMTYIDGPTLTEFVEEGSYAPINLAAMMLAVGDSLQNAHEHGVVHCDVKPSHILIDKRNGHAKLTDFGAAIDRDNVAGRIQGVGTFGYSAPEVLHREENVDGRADVFALARTIAYIFYRRPLPTPYSISSLDLADRLNCDYRIKTVLKRGLDPEPERRYKMSEFVRELEAAVSPGAEPVPARTIVRQERYKMSQTIAHAVLGTLCVMLAIRPTLTYWNLAHLSDRFEVALFHAFIGSLVWGSFITFAFLLYWIKYHRTDRSGFVIAGLFCMFAGLAGGIVCAGPSVTVTNTEILYNLGWLSQKIANTDTAGRFSQSLLETRMFFAFPLTGTLTGLGLGLFLNHTMNYLLARNVPGLLPLPVKDLRPEDDPLFTSLQLVFRPAHIFLLMPVLGSWLSMFVLSPSIPEPLPAGFWKIVVDHLGAAFPQSLGEGVVHYVGAVGLSVGFFFGVGSKRK
jgi:Protein kinase domain